MGQRALLIIDNFKGHINKQLDLQLKIIRTDIKRLLSNATGYLHPMDLTVDSPFKQFYETYWGDYQFDLKPTNVTPSGNSKVPSREGKILWILKAWKEVSDEIHYR